MGIVFDIQRFCIHDGPGIRTTVFLKGCPLRCRWCQNPESWISQPQLMLSRRGCISCHRCEEVCPEGAIGPGEQGPVLDREKCKSCFNCVARCPSGCLKAVGRDYSVAEVLAEVMKDEAYYRHSGGGITLSGGEPLMQPEFALSLLEESRSRGLHTAVETCGFAAAKTMEAVGPVTDYLIFDLKLSDPRQHLLFTGKENHVILQNLALVAAGRNRENFLVRVPLVPGYTLDEDNIKGLAASLNRVAFNGRVELIPYHRLGAGKYSQLGLEYSLESTVEPPEEEIARARRWFLEAGIDICGD